MAVCSRVEQHMSPLSVYWRRCSAIPALLPAAGASVCCFRVGAWQSDYNQLNAWRDMEYFEASFLFGFKCSQKGKLVLPCQLFLHGPVQNIDIDSLLLEGRFSADYVKLWWLRLWAEANLTYLGFDLTHGISFSPLQFQFCKYTAYTVDADTLAHVVCVFILGGRWEGEWKSSFHSRMWLDLRFILMWMAAGAL